MSKSNIHSNQYILFYGNHELILSTAFLGCISTFCPRLDLKLPNSPVRRVWLRSKYFFFHELDQGFSFNKPSYNIKSHVFGVLFPFPLLTIGDAVML